MEDTLWSRKGLKVVEDMESGKVIFRTRTRTVVFKSRKQAFECLVRLF